MWHGPLSDDDFMSCREDFSMTGGETGSRHDLVSLALWERTEAPSSLACRLNASFHARYPPGVTPETIASRSGVFNREACGAGEAQ